MAEPDFYLPIAFAATQQNQGSSSRSAVAILEQMFSGEVERELLYKARQFLKSSSINLANLGKRIYEKILIGIGCHESGDIALRALFLNHYSDFLSDIGSDREALPRTAESVAMFDELANRGDEFIYPHLLSMIALSKRLSVLGLHAKAIKEAEKVLRKLDFVDKSKFGFIAGFDRFVSIALCNFAQCCFSANQHERGIQSARRAWTILTSLKSEDEDVTRELASACLVFSAGLLEMGQYDEGYPVVKQAYELYYALAAQYRTSFVGEFMDAAHSYAIALKRIGNVSKSARVAAQSIERLQEMAELLPQKYQKGLVTELVAYSAYLGEVGKRDEALVIAVQALKEARKFGRLVGSSDIILEIGVFNNLSCREFDNRDFTAALRHARTSVRLLKHLDREHPQRAYLLGQSLRNCAEAMRITASSKASRTKALNTAKLAVCEILSVNRPNSRAVCDLKCLCLATQAKCFADMGKFEQATLAEWRSLKLRTILYFETPALYEHGRASSLCSLASYLLECGRKNTAILMIEKSILHYEKLALKSGVHIWEPQLRAVQTQSRILAACSRPNDALNCLKQVIRNSRHSLGQLDDTSVSTLSEVVREHDSLAKTLNMPTYA
jgi:hypothetical protein